MSFETDNASRSFYRPSTVYMKFNPAYIEESGIPKAQYLPIFLHEYAHLIQDTTTCYGVLDFILFMDSINEISKIAKSGSTIKLPITASPLYRDSWLNGIAALKNSTRPSTEWQEGSIWAFESFEPTKYNYFKYGIHNYRVPVIQAKFIDNCTEKAIIHEIGVREIKEAYSMAVESIYRNSQEPFSTDQFEYFAIERILSKELTSVTPETIAVICHWALQSDHPAENFIQLIDVIKCECCDAANHQNVFDVLKRDFVSTKSTLIPMLQKSIEDMISNRSMAGDGDFVFNLLKWYKKEVLGNVVSVLSDDYNFPINSSLIDKGVNLSETMAAYPIPLYESENLAFQMNPKISDEISQNAYFLVCLSAIADKIIHSTSANWLCAIHNLCSPETIAFKDFHCESTPWLHTSQQKPCPYSAACTYIGIDSKTKFVL